MEERRKATAATGGDTAIAQAQMEARAAHLRKQRDLIVAQRKKDEQTKLEMKQQAQERRKASGSTDFSVTQSYWSAKKKSKVPARVQLGVTVDGVRITASVDGEDEVIETITVQNIVSWETIKDKETFRLTVSNPPPHLFPPNQAAC